MIPGACREAVRASHVLIRALSATASALTAACSRLWNNFARALRHPLLRNRGTESIRRTSAFRTAHSRATNGQISCKRLLARIWWFVGPPDDRLTLCGHLRENERSHREAPPLRGRMEQEEGEEEFSTRLSRTSSYRAPLSRVIKHRLVCESCGGSDDKILGRLLQTCLSMKLWVLARD